MSYCRFSDKYYKCDIYTYYVENDCYCIHVARGRYCETGNPNNPKKIKIINIPHAGDTFYENSLDDFLNRLYFLRKLGFNIPEFVFNEVKYEIALEESEED